MIFQGNFFLTPIISDFSFPHSNIIFGLSLGISKRSYFENKFSLKSVSLGVNERELFPWI